MKPWELRAEEPIKAAELVAIYEVEQKIQHYYDSEQAKRVDQLKVSSGK